MTRKPGFRVLGRTGDLGQTERLIGELAPDLVITDWMLDSGGALDVLDFLRKHRERAKVLILTGVRTPEAVAAALAAGAVGYVLKDSGLDVFFEALEQVLGGEIYISPSLRDEAREYGAEAQRKPASRLSDLTPRERQTLGCICEGLTSRQIAHQLGISLRTVESHRANLRKKLRLRTVAALTAFALANDLCRR